MKSNNKQKSNEPNITNHVSKDETNMNEKNSPQKDGFRYDYDDSSDV
jgi:hypothetical protein